MKKLPLLIAIAAWLTLAACDNNLPPTKAPELDQAPQADPAPKPATGADQPPPAQ